MNIDIMMNKTWNVKKGKMSGEKKFFRFLNFLLKTKGRRLKTKLFETLAFSKDPQEMALFFGYCLHIINWLPFNLLRSLLPNTIFWIYTNHVSRALAISYYNIGHHETFNSNKIKKSTVKFLLLSRREEEWEGVEQYLVKIFL